MRMNTIESGRNAQEIFKTNAVSLFEAVDPYNPGNHVSGWLCRAEGAFYGSLLINEVNGGEAPMLVRGTPKIGYPFDKQGRWTFPSAKKINAYEKLDGTNILEFEYYNSLGFKFVSYKTRLLPFLRDGGKWGDFKSMWDRMIERHPAIPTLCKVNGCNVSFELYGSANPHLILYEVPLETAILFGVNNAGKIIDLYNINDCKVPRAKLMATIDGQYVESYQWQKSEMQKKLVVLVDGESYRGIEGQVWYMTLEDGSVVQFKCKPDEIESIHFSQGRRLSKTTIVSTCLNALENTDVLSYDFIVELLAEEYSRELISLSKDLILDTVKKVQRDLEFKQTVIAAYREAGVNILVDKRTAMRAMSTYFPKTEITRVYSAIMAYETIGKK